MTAEDVKMIFSNVAELAVFADMFSEELEGALGRVVDGGQGDDRVGELFLRIVSRLLPTRLLGYRTQNGNRPQI